MDSSGSHRHRRCLAAVLAFCAERAWRSKHRVVAVLCGILLLLQGIGTLAFSLRRAQELMIFGGDAGWGRRVADLNSFRSGTAARHPSQLITEFF